MVLFLLIFHRFYIMRTFNIYNIQIIHYSIIYIVLSIICLNGTGVQYINIINLTLKSHHPDMFFL